MAKIHPNAYRGRLVHVIVFRLEDHGQYGLYRMRPNGSGLHAILKLSSFKPRFIDWGPRTTP